MPPTIAIIRGRGLATCHFAGLSRPQNTTVFRFSFFHPAPKKSLHLATSSPDSSGDFGGNAIRLSAASQRLQKYDVSEMSKTFMSAGVVFRGVQRAKSGQNLWCKFGEKWAKVQHAYVRIQKKQKNRARAKKIIEGPNACHSTFPSYPPSPSHSSSSS